MGNHMLWMQSAFPLSADDRVLQKTTLNFDASVWECFAPLIAGARLVLARPDGQKDRAYLVEAIRRHGVTVLKVVPSLLRSLLGEPSIRDCTSLRLVLCGGEALSGELQRQFADTLGAELHNLYGPTEAAVDVTSWPARSPMHLPTVPIGRPIHNTRAYVLDPRLRPVRVGVAGELHVAGASLARGYLDQPALTAERFVPDPFGVEPGVRLYRTGDLVVVGPAGALRGAQLGIMAGGLLDPPKVKGPRLDDLSFQTSTYGSIIPRVYGTVALHGNVFWLKGNSLTETSSTSGGKGGPEVTSYSYSATFAVGLCQGPIEGIRRIWVGSQLWYDAGANDIESIIARNQQADRFNLYLGSLNADR